MKNLESNRQQMDRPLDINLSPLIDCIFILLIFFVVTTTFVKDRGIQVDRPRAVTAEEVEQTAMRFTLTAEGLVYFDGNPVHIEQVRGLVARQLAGETAPVMILADRACPSGRLIELIDECKLAGASSVSVATGLP